MKKILASSVTLVLIGFLALAALELPILGSADSLANNAVAKLYVDQAISDTGAVNVVAAMILDYRAFDTFVEASVIFTALTAVIGLLKKGGSRYED